MAGGKDQTIIVGAGVMGLCTAYYLLKSGTPVVVLDRGDESTGNCSMGNAGMVVPSHFTPLAAPGMIAKGLRWMFNPRSPFYVRPRPSMELIRWGWLFHRHSTAAHVAETSPVIRDLNLDSRALFTELQQEEDFGLRQKGLLMLCKTAKGLDEESEVAEAAHHLGLRAEVLDPAATAALDRGITMDIAGSVYFPDDCHMDPAAFMRSLRKRVLALGGRIIDHAEVTAIERKDGSIVAVSGPMDRWEGKHFVIAGGSESPRLLKHLGMRLPMQPGKGYSLTLGSPRQLPNLCSILSEAKVAVTPMNGALRFAGTMEIGSFEPTINPERVRGIIGSVNRYFPGFSESDFEGITPWAGLRPVSPDGVPYIGRAPVADNLFIATGHAMMGLSLGPVTGRIISDLITGAGSPLANHTTSPGRFH